VLSAYRQGDSAGIAGRAAIDSVSNLTKALKETFG
jgi:hypothetical protein